MVAANHRAAMGTGGVATQEPNWRAGWTNTGMWTEFVSKTTARPVTRCGDECPRCRIWVPSCLFGCIPSTGSGGGSESSRTAQTVGEKIDSCTRCARLRKICIWRILQVYKGNHHSVLGKWSLGQIVNRADRVAVQ